MFPKATRTFRMKNKAKHDTKVELLLSLIHWILHWHVIVSAAQGLFFNSQDWCHFPFCQPNEHCVNSVSASELNKSFYSSLTLLKWLLKLPTICSLWVLHALVSHDSCSFPFFLPREAKARDFPSATPLFVSYWRSFPFDHLCYSHPQSLL